MMLEATRKNCREREGGGGHVSLIWRQRERKWALPKSSHGKEELGHDSYISSSLFTAHHP